MSRSIACCVGAAFAFSLAVGVPSYASAEASPPPTSEQKVVAMAKFDAGSRAFAERRYKEAIDLFLEADHLIQHPAFAFNASLAYESMGDVAAALRWANEYLHRVPNAEDRAETELRIRRFQIALRERGLQQVTVRSDPPGATVLIDGQAVGVSP